MNSGIIIVLISFAAKQILCSAKPIEYQDNAIKTDPCSNDTLVDEDLRSLCESVYSNEYVKWSERMMQDPEFASSVEVVMTSNEGVKRERRSVKQCPVFTPEYISSQSQLKQLSTSPWKYVLDVNHNRIPHSLLTSECLCDGCIGLDDGREDINLASVPLYSEVPVVMVSTKTKFSKKFGIGCTCVFP